MPLVEILQARWGRFAEHHEEGRGSKSHPDVSVAQGSLDIEHPRPQGTATIAPRITVVSIMRAAIGRLEVALRLVRC